MESPTPAPDPARLRTRQLVALALAVSLLLLCLELSTAVLVRARRDRHELVSRERLTIALLTFRPAEHRGLPRDVPGEDLATANLVRSDPHRCSPLALLAVAPPLDAQSWTGINGSPAAPVTTLTVRFADAGAARAALREKRLALLRCRRLALTFPPFDQPAEHFTVTEQFRPANLGGSTLSYVLVGEPQRYTFFTARYGNTLTWTYGDDAGARHRRQVVLDLSARLAELSQE